MGVDWTAITTAGTAVGTLTIAAVSPMVSATGRSRAYKRLAELTNAEIHINSASPSYFSDSILHAKLECMKEIAIAEYAYAFRQRTGSRLAKLNSTAFPILTLASLGATLIDRSSARLTMYSQAAAFFLIMSLVSLGLHWAIARSFGHLKVSKAAEAERLRSTARPPVGAKVNRPPSIA